MACVRYEVKVQEPVLVQPLSAALTEESNAAYFLTSLDREWASVVVETVLVFDAVTRRCDRDDSVHPAKIMKEALRKVLVHFYPLAGRLRLSPHDDGKMFIECNAQGVSFVEADANVHISHLGDFSQPDAATLRPLVFAFPAVDDRPLLTAQVTRFKCGGFVLGLVFQHFVLDGLAWVEFMTAWAETARGKPLSTPPVLDRTFLSSGSPLQIKYPHTEFQEIEDLSSTQHSNNTINRSFYFTSVSLEILKKKVLEKGVLSKCSTFEALCGLIWRARTRAIWSDHSEQKVKLLVVIDGRSKFKPTLPKGYVGNGVMLTYALTSVRKLEENPLSYTVKLVQDAIGCITDDYLRSHIDYIEGNNLLGLPPLGATLAITTWSSLPFDIVDFGWGKARHIAPVSLMVKEMALFLPFGGDKKGINVMVSLPHEAMHKFEELLHPHLNPGLLCSKF